VARYLLSTQSLVELVRRDPEQPVARWAGTLDEHLHELLVSVVSIGQLKAALHALPAHRTEKVPLTESFEDALHQFAARRCILDFTTRCALKWSELVALPLDWTDPVTARTVSLPSLNRQIVAQALADDIPIELVEAPQPCHATLRALGLRVHHP